MLVHRLSDWLARQIWLRILTSKKLAKPESMPEPSNSGSDPDTSDEQSRNSAREIRHMFDVRLTRLAILLRFPSACERAVCFRRGKVVRSH